jgi:hypothetical protein
MLAKTGIGPSRTCLRVAQKVSWTFIATLRSSAVPKHCATD